MLGRAVVAHCTTRNDQVVAHDHKSLNIADTIAVGAKFDQERPGVVINCAAWTDVDGCELDPARAFEVNARGPENLAEHCRRINAALITVSTDYVFDGQKEGFYTQRDDPNPQSVYASAKLEGERRAQNALARTIVVRSGWIFGVGGRNFLSRIIELTREGQRLNAISDAYGTPTSAVDLATRLRALAELDLPGIYHVVNSGEGASYEEFARAMLEAAGLEQASLNRVSMDSLKRPAPRPRNSRLSCLLSDSIGLEPLPFWKDSVSEFVAKCRLGEKSVAIND